MENIALYYKLILALPVIAITVTILATLGLITPEQASAIYVSCPTC